MSRVQKKCLIGSAGFHLFLLVILFAGPQLMASKSRPDDTQAITMVDLSKLTDGPTKTGGNASPPPAPAPPQPPAATPTPPAPPEPPPKPPEPKSFLKELFQPDPPKPEKPTVDVSDDQKIKVKSQDEDAPIKVKEKPKIEVASHKVHVNPNVAKENAAKESAAEEAKAAASAAKARKAILSRVESNLQSGLSSSTEVSIPGANASTFINYGEAVRIKYTDAWIPPADVTDDNATVKVSVTIARDGTVVTAKVTVPSGNTPVDHSVEQTLHRVKLIAPFPDGATDDERTFIINFNLKAKRLTG